MHAGGVAFPVVGAEQQEYDRCKNLTRTGDGENFVRISTFRNMWSAQKVLGVASPSQRHLRHNPRPGVHTTVAVVVVVVVAGAAGGAAGVLFLLLCGRTRPCVLCSLVAC